MQVERSERLAGCELTWRDKCIAVTGEVDHFNAGPIGDRVCEAISGSVTVMDLREVTFFAAAGVHLLRTVARVACAADAIVQVSCSHAVWRSLDLCQATELPGLVLDPPSSRDGEAPLP